MIDLKDLRERPEHYQRGCDRKAITLNIQEFLELDQKYRSLNREVESLRAAQKNFNKELASLPKDQKGLKLEEMKVLSHNLKALSTQLKEIESEWNQIQLRIPTPPLDCVPDGKDDTENVEVRKVGTPKTFPFKAKDHVELGSALNIIDIERGVKIAGARNYFLKGDGARLQHAVLQLAMDHLHQKGYLLFDPPLIVKYEAMMGTGYFPGGEDQAFQLDQRDAEHFLIGTSEVPVCAYHYDEVLKLEELPKRYAGCSPCFRREAGAYGKDTHGLYRVHQFHKVEQVVVCEANAAASEALHYELLNNAEEVLQQLELPYRVVDVCTGDLGLGQAWKHDIETWMPSRDSYSETHSCSTFYDFQARRLGIRYKDGNGKNQYCFTLNNTCIASPRILIPLLENHQQEDGSVYIPKALQPYMAGLEKIAAFS